MTHNSTPLTRKGQFVEREYNWRCSCGEHGKWKPNRLEAEGLFSIHVRDEKEKGKNPNVQRVQELRRSSAAGPVNRDKPRSAEKRALRLEWFE